MILYSNLTEVKVNGKKMKSQAVLNLTSSKINGEISSEIHTLDRMEFLLKNHFSQQQIKFIDALFNGAMENNFIVKLGKSK
jgi:uncharacterized protein (DUF1800 family)